jgi:integrase
MTRPRGTVRQRASGRWYVQLSVTEAATGKRSRPTIGPFATKREARTALTAALAERDAGTHVVPSAEPVADYLRAWLDSRRHDLRPTTLHGYRGVVARYVVPAIGAVPLRDLKPQHLQALYARMQDGGLSARTVRTVHVVLHRAFADAVLHQVLARNPCDAVRPPRLSPVEMATWDADQVAAFLRHVRASADPETNVAVHVAAMTGMRRGEVCGLRWDDIDLDAGTIRVTRTRVVVAGEVRDGEPKTSRSRRVIDIDRFTVTALREWKLAQPPSPDVVTQHPETLSDRFDALVKSSGLPRIRFHDLRHTHVTLLLSNGVPVHVVSARVGHANANITLGVYAHVLPGADGEAADLFARLVTQVVTDTVTQRSPNAPAQVQR